jgi:hypothetical protein
MTSSSKQAAGSATANPDTQTNAKSTSGSHNVSSCSNTKNTANVAIANEHPGSPNPTLLTTPLLTSLTTAASIVNHSRLNFQNRIYSKIDSFVRRSAIQVCDRVVEPVVDKVVDAVKTRVLVPVAKRGREFWRREVRDLVLEY